MISRRPDHNWQKINSAPSPTPRPCLFLDRDGVLIEERNYLCDPDLVELVPGAPDAITSARALGWAVVVVTNQSGIARGKFGWEEYEAVEQRLEDLLAAAGARVDMVLACPHLPDGKPPYNFDPNNWRKPGPGMLLEAARVMNLDLTRSILVGDKGSDLEAAAAAGLKTAVHVLTGHGGAERAELANALGRRIEVAPRDSIADIPAILG